MSMGRDYKFCPKCKSALSIVENRVSCTSCDFLTYLNPAPTASAIPIKDGKVLIAIKGIEPHKGAYDLIGGFIEENESAEEGTIRETKEETGLTVEIDKYLGSYADVYGSKEEPTLTLTYTVKIISGEPKADDDVADLIWVPIKDIPTLKFNGFKNTKEALMDLYNQSK